MIETEQLLLEGVLESAAYERYQAALSERKYEYRTDFLIPETEDPTHRKYFTVDPVSGPRIYYPDSSGSSSLYKDVNGVVCERVDDDDIFVHRTPKADEIARYTQRLIEAVPVVSETGIADRVNGMFDTVEAKLAAVPFPIKFLVAKYDTNDGRTQNVSIDVEDNSYFMDRRLTVNTSSGDYLQEITIARNNDGKLSMSTQTYRCDTGSEYDYVDTKGTVMTHADLDVLEHVVFCSQIHVPNRLQAETSSPQSLGRRVVALFQGR